MIKKYDLFAGGGELKAVFTNLDWNNFAAGEPDHWSEALRATVALMLDTKLAAWVCWGSELHVLYNDAYCNLLGIKPPFALAKPFWTLWPAAKDTLEPVILSALTGTPSFLENKEFIFARNGHIESVWASISVAPIRIADGTVVGVFGMANETTHQVRTRSDKANENQRLHSMFAQAPGFMAMLRGPDHVFEMVNKAYLQAVGFRDLLNRPIREALPELKGQGYYELLDQVYATGVPYVSHGMPVHIQRTANAELELLIINFVYQPVIENGKVVGIFVEGSDVSVQHTAQSELAEKVQRLEEIEKRLAFQLDLTDRIREIADADEVMAATSDLLGSFLNVSRVIYYEIDTDTHHYAMKREWLNKGQFSISLQQQEFELLDREILPALALGEPIAINDISSSRYNLEHLESYSRNHVRALLFVPLLKSGKLVAMVNLHQQHIFQWTDENIVLVKDTLERTWAVLEKVRAQAALQAERDQSHYIFENMSEGFAIINFDWQMLEINNEGLRVAQRTQDEVVGKNLWNVWPELIGTEVETRYQRVMTTRQADIFEQNVAFSNGNTLWLEIRLQPIPNGGMAVIYRNISDRKNAEQVLLVSERNALDAAGQAENERRLLDALLDAAPVGIGMADPHGKLIRHNRANKELWGGYLPQSESVHEYDQWKAWWADGSERHGRRLQPHEWALARALKGDYPSQDIVEIETFDTPPLRRIIALSARPVYDAKGDIVGGVVAQTDITDQTKTESALRASEARFRTIANAMPQMVWSLLHDGSKDYFNQRWYDFTGIPAGALDGEAWNGIVHPDDHQQTYSLWQHSLKTGENYEVEYRLRHNSGNFRWILARAVPVTDDDGIIVRWMGTCTDIHDQKLTQEALRIADRRKDEFLAMLAHELRNPLAPIAAAADLLQVASVNPDQVKHTSKVIARQVKHMTSLVDDLLDVSRVTRGLIHLENIVINAADIVAEAVEQVRPLIESRQHRLQIQLPSETVFVQGDRKRLIQVITNVLNNAAKYTPEGGRIDLTMAADNAQVIFHVSDNGIGMTEETLHQVFELFAQAERSPDRSIGGLGIGLALVKSLVEHHHGDVTAHSFGLNKGSKFIVTLPRVRQHSNIATIEVNNQPSTHTKKLRILLVDDNADAADILAMLLEISGYDVMVERHAKGAIERIQSQVPDICLLDIGLPDMDGNELAQYLRRQPETETAVLIAITGYGQSEDRKKTTSSGFNHHFVKPVDTPALIALLDQLDAKKINITI